MFNTTIGRVFIALAVTVLLISATLSHPVNMAVDPEVGVAYSVDINGDFDDDTSSGDLFLPLLTTGFIALAAMIMLVGFNPRPAARIRAFHYPVQPQGPPSQH